MKEFIYLIFLSLTMASCIKPSPKLPSAAQVDSLRESSLTKDEIKYPDSVFNKSFQLRSGERFLRLEVVLNASLDSVWHSFSTEEGIKTWMAPVSQVDFKIGGEMKNHMNYKKKIGDPGTLTLGVINFIPNEIVTVHLDKYFGERPAIEDMNWQEVVQIIPISKYKTIIVSTMVGWGIGPDWDKAYSFFERGNKWYFNVMQKGFKTGPIYWPNDP